MIFQQNPLVTSKMLEDICNSYSIRYNVQPMQVLTDYIVLLSYHNTPSEAVNKLRSQYNSRTKR